MEVKIRNAVRVDDGKVDCEYFDDRLQIWLPTTITDGDPEQADKIAALASVTIDVSSEIALEKNKEILSTLIKRECRSRILAIMSESDYANLTAARAAGRLSDDQALAFDRGLDWVAAMRGVSNKLIDLGKNDYTLDSHWPLAPKSVIDLIEAF